GAGSAVSPAMDKTIADLRAKGATVERIRLDEQLARRLLTLWVELFGFVMGQTLSWPVRKLIYWQYSKLLKRSSLPATKALRSGLGLSLKRLSAALKERDEVIAEVNRLCAQVDVVISPTSLGPAFPHNHKHESIMLDGEKVPYVDYCFPFVMLYNLTGQPVLTVPTGLTDSGLPIGLSFAAKHHQEPTLLHLGKLLEAAGYQHTPPQLEV
ncbi:amidase family protein, partial [Pseudidiomarina aquimaris]|uniref:amidase family protein n=1 Tax=Pseudidiomarina aquimaris TaxID=641841 RepID=UPI003A969CC3